MAHKLGRLRKDPDYGNLKPTKDQLAEVLRLEGFMRSRHMEVDTRADADDYIAILHKRNGRSFGEAAAYVGSSGTAPPDKRSRPRRRKPTAAQLHLFKELKQELGLPDLVPPSTRVEMKKALSELQSQRDKKHSR